MFQIWPLGWGWDLPLGGSLDGIRLIEAKGLEGEVFAALVEIWSGLLLTCVSCGETVALIDEAVRAAEAFLVPYTRYEHSRRVFVVRKPRLNRDWMEGL